MAIQATKNVLPVYNLRYSAFLGMLYVSTDASEALIREAKAQVGESEVKKGFTGNIGESPSARAVAALRAKGVTSSNVTGFLSSARVVDKVVDGRPTPYLQIGLRDEAGRYYISVDLSQPAAQMAVRKLVNAEPGQFSQIELFATFSQKEGASRAFANHSCTLKQNGAEVVSVNPKDQLVPRVESALQALESAGVSPDDRETFAKRRAKVTIDFHRELMDAVNQKFNDFYEKREISSETEESSLKAAYTM
jgi:hypothetical protein